MMTNANAADFDTAIAAYIAALDARAAEDFARLCPNLVALGKSAPSHTVEVGPKFVRIVRGDGVSRSAFGFVERATGLIYKAAGWKGPARNFPRGSIFDLANAPKGYSAR